MKRQADILAGDCSCFAHSHFMLVDVSVSVHPPIPSTPGSDQARDQARDQTRFAFEFPSTHMVRYSVIKCSGCRRHPQVMAFERNRLCRDCRLARSPVTATKVICTCPQRAQYMSISFHWQGMTPNAVRLLMCSPSHRPLRHPLTAAGGLLREHRASGIM
jgi:hypothetical protein